MTLILDTGEKDWSAPSPQRGKQLLRALILIEILATYRQAASIEELRHEVGERTGEFWHLRTIRRDIATLELCGLVEGVRKVVRRSHRVDWRLAPHFGAIRAYRLLIAAEPAMRGVHA